MTGHLGWAARPSKRGARVSCPCQQGPATDLCRHRPHLGGQAGNVVCSSDSGTAAGVGVDTDLRCRTSGKPAQPRATGDRARAPGPRAAFRQHAATLTCPPFDPCCLAGLLSRGSEARMERTRQTKYPRKAECLRGWVRAAWGHPAGPHVLGTQGTWAGRTARPLGSGSELASVASAPQGGSWVVLRHVPTGI